jgi:hypothetical protein
MNHSRIILIALLCLPLVISAADGHSTRTWTSTKGTKLKAALIADNGDTLKLKLSSGKTIGVPRNKLSADDHVYLDTRTAKLKKLITTIPEDPMASESAKQNVQLYESFLDQLAKAKLSADEQQAEALKKAKVKVQAQVKSAGTEDAKSNKKTSNGALNTGPKFARKTGSAPGHRTLGGGIGGGLGTSSKRSGGDPAAAMLNNWDAYVADQQQQLDNWYRTRQRNLAKTFAKNNIRIQAGETTDGKTLAKGYAEAMNAK